MQAALAADAAAGAGPVEPPPEPKPPDPAEAPEPEVDSEAGPSYMDMGVSKIGVPQNGWFTMGNPIKMDDLVVPLFLETLI